MATSSRRSGGTAFRSLSPSGRFCYSSRPTLTSSTAFASSTSSLFHQRSASPPPVIMCGHQSSSSFSATTASALRFPLDRRPTSPGRSIAAISNGQNHRQQIAKPQKRTCMCSPTTHPGSFRCSLHKGLNINRGGSHAPPPPSNRLNARRSAMTNSLVRICGVEGDLVKRALAALIRPSSHHQRRRADFQPRPSRLSIMSKAEESS